MSKSAFTIENGGATFWIKIMFNGAVRCLMVRKLITVMFHEKAEL